MNPDKSTPKDVKRFWFSLILITTITTFLVYLFQGESSFSTININSKKIAQTVISIENNEIIVSNFPRPTMGITSQSGEDFGEFSFSELDHYVYNIAIKSNYDFLYIVIRYTHEDKYGNKTLGEKITIGAINTAESKKYKDFSYWRKRHSTYKMWSKDKKEDEEKYKSNNSYGSFKIVPAYKPKSIR